ncbi:MAG: glycoside hydrolase family 2 protein [Bacteroidia bacterium]|nr:glycoside hydrolase family 2 protein [Bacteroidia bacterium]
MRRSLSAYLRIRYIMLFIAVVLVSCQQKNAVLIRPLNEGWMLHVDSQQSIKATVPGLVHTDLLSAGLIPDPYYGFNEDSLQWIGSRQWVYSLDFDIDKSILNNRNIALVFDGLDTYAQVKLNGQPLLWADNMFRQWELDVKALLLEGANRLEVRFFQPDSISLVKAQSYGIKLPEHRAFSRKAPFQAGWDWGPVFHTMGIWKPVSLVAWNGSWLREAAILTHHADSLLANLELAAGIESEKPGSARVRLLIDDKVLIENDLQLFPGFNNIRLPFSLKNPSLWWPSGSGAQHLNRFELEIRTSFGELHHKTITNGIRKAELVREADSIGEGFAFRINGRDIFAKGANYIPEDHFITRMSRHKTRKLLIDAAAAGMNMIRVWGGGIYPSEDFYDLCDSLGLMVWQDFIFACTMYPWDTAFLENVRQEAIHQVKRLRGHPSMVLWCGNNEVSEGFHNWGWQRSIGWTATDSASVWHGYLTLFEQLIPEVLTKHDPGIPYWPSSPSLGWGRAESLRRGDVHYWGVWWGEEPFEVYRKKVGRFNSEYGFQAMPAIESVRQFLPEDQLIVGSAGLEAHQKHPRGTKLIHDYMARDFPVPRVLEDYIYTSQLTQMHGIGMAIEAHRRNKPVTMGTLYWQLNDSWPVTSWSSIDYYGRWKGLHYRLRQLYAPVLLSFAETEGNVAVYGISDLSEVITGTLEISFLNTQGETLQTRKTTVTLNPAKATSLAIIPPSDLPVTLPKESMFIRAKLVQKEQTLAENLFSWARPKDLKLSYKPIEIEKEIGHDLIFANLSSEVLHYAVQLQSNDTDGRFSDNFFHLYPGEPRTITFKPSGNVPVGEITFGWRSLNLLVNH